MPGLKQQHDTDMVIIKHNVPKLYQGYFKDRIMHYLNKGRSYHDYFPLVKYKDLPTIQHSIDVFVLSSDVKQNVIFDSELHVDHANEKAPHRYRLTLDRLAKTIILNMRKGEKEYEERHPHSAQKSIKKKHNTPNLPILPNSDSIRYTFPK